MRPTKTPAAAAAAVSGTGFAVLLALVAAGWEPLLALDRAVAADLHGEALARPGLTRTARVLTDWVWDPWTMRLLTSAAAAVLWRRGERSYAACAVGAALAGLVLQQALKSAVGRGRPRWRHPVDSAHFAAFPSGHALAAAVACGLLLWVLRRHGAVGVRWGAALAAGAVSAAGAGASRLWLGVHWLSDVVGGWLLGVCVVALSVVCYGRLALSRAR
ncbi:phosphatase PAP2 family protein [Streptomyces sp. NPDC047002]|uniref:phosphatase PAP2 family protein n=1 Tax=Streptomyces sp. NPDC047002 TaxID=3155475 RepID=UPI003456A9EB